MNRNPVIGYGLEYLMDEVGKNDICFGNIEKREKYVKNMMNARERITCVRYLLRKDGLSTYREFE